MGIEIEFPLDRARSAMEPSQIQRSLFEDSGRQFFLAVLELLIVPNVSGGSARASLKSLRLS